MAGFAGVIVMGGAAIFNGLLFVHSCPRNHSGASLFPAVARNEGGNRMKIRFILDKAPCGAEKICNAYAL